MKIVDLLGGQAEYYLNHTCKTIDKQLIRIPGPDMIDKVWMNSDRNIRTLESLQALYGHGRLAWINDFKAIMGFPKKFKIYIDQENYLYWLNKARYTICLLYTSRCV